MSSILRQLPSQGAPSGAEDWSELICPSRFRSFCFEQFISGRQQSTTSFVIDPTTRPSYLHWNTNAGQFRERIQSRNLSSIPEKEKY